MPNRREITWVRYNAAHGIRKPIHRGDRANTPDSLREPALSRDPGFSNPRTIAIVEKDALVRVDHPGRVDHRRRNRVLRRGEPARGLPAPGCRPAGR